MGLSAIPPQKIRAPHLAPRRASRGQNSRAAFNSVPVDVILDRITFQYVLGFWHLSRKVRRAKKNPRDNQHLSCPAPTNCFFPPRLSFLMDPLLECSFSEDNHARHSQSRCAFFAQYITSPERLLTDLMRCRPV